MNLRLLVRLALLLCAVPAFGAVAQLEFPLPGYPDSSQAIGFKEYELDQKIPRRIAWGISARFSGISKMVKPSHHKYGIEIRLVFDDGTSEWFEPSRKFSAKNPDWQHFCGVISPRKAVSKAVFYYRIATPGKAWYDGMTLFELPPEPVREPCRLMEKDGVYTLENEFLSMTLKPREGATVSRFVDRKTGAGYAAEHINSRLFLDRFRQGGVCYKRAWKAEIKKATDDEVSVEVKMSGPDGYRYLDVSRIMSLKRDSAALDVSYRWYNQPASMADVVIEPWIVCGFTPYGGRGQHIAYPTAEGIRSVGPGGDVIKHKDVIGGWYAAGAADRRTMALTFDWANYAETWHYLAGDDTLISDLIFQPVKIAAGSSFATDCSLFPLPGVKIPHGAENGISAGIEPVADDIMVKFDAAKCGVYNAELVAVAADGAEKTARTVVYLAPDKTVKLPFGLPRSGTRSVAVRLFSAGNLVFDAERSFEKGYVYKPKKAKAKPATVKPFSLELKTDLVTAHTSFARPWARGRPRVLFLTSIHQAREIVELMQRADIDARALRIASSEEATAWSMIERFGTYKYSDMNASLKREIEDGFDVVVISGDMMKPIDRDNRAAIERRIAAGAGVVRIGTENPELAGNPDAAQWISGNVSPELLVAGAGKVRAADVGAHREVMLDYDARNGITPFTGYDRVAIPPFRYQDYSFSVVARAIFWAAKLDGAVPADARRTEEVVAAGPGMNIRHVFWKGGKGVYDWSAKIEPVQKAASITNFVLACDDVKTGGTVEGVFGCSGGIGKVELFDGFGRLMSVDVPSGDGRFALSIPEARTGLLTVKATVSVDGKCADAAEKDVICRRPLMRPDFPLCISEGATTYAGEKEYLLAARARIYRDLGINFIRYWESDRIEAYKHMLRHGFESDFSIYDARLPGNFNKLYVEPYSATRDKKHLVRKPCLHDPEYCAALDSRIRANARRIARFCPLTCDCGDENTLTLWTTPFDFCFSEHTLREFRKWLQGEYGSIANLNASWMTDYRAWDDVVPDTTLEARARAKRTGKGSYAAWADHRRFMELTFCESIARVSRILKEEIPGAELDMSGTQAPNGWTGMDMWLVAKSVGEPAAYQNGLLADYVRSFGRPFVKPWTGYGVQPKELETWSWQTVFTFLDAGLYFWTGFNFLLPDYSPTPSAVQYGKVGDEMKSGAARLVRSLEYRHEVLIHYSYASIHAAQIESRYEGFNTCSIKWADMLRERGIPFRFVAYAEIEAGELDRTSAKTLILPQSAAISDCEAAAIRRFAARGGKVVGDGYTGIFDQHCRRREKPVLTDVICRELDFGPAPEDGVSVYVMHPKDGIEGRYWGFVRDLHAGEKTAERTVHLDEIAYVYDLRNKRALGRVKSFTVPLKSAEVAFYAALPYELGAVSVASGDARRGGEVEVVVKVDMPAGAKACHPVKIDIYDPDGRRSALYSGLCDAKGGAATMSFRTALNDAAGTWRVVATDYVTGRTASSSFVLR